MELRPYQKNALSMIRNYYKHGGRSGCVVLPTGAGKSVIFADICLGALSKNNRVVVLQDTFELIEQGIEKIPEEQRCYTGVYSASLNRKESQSSIVFAQIQSCYKKAHLFSDASIVIVDEAHKIAPEDTTRYQTFIQGIREDNPEVFILGLTATPFRTGQGLIYGDGGFFDDLIYEESLLSLVKQGWLSPVRTAEIETSVDFSNSRLSGGEFIDSELEEIFMDKDVLDGILRESIPKIEKSKGALFFCSNVSHAKRFTAILNSLGFVSECVTGETPKEERVDIVARYKAQEIKCLVNVNVLTTGFDAPHTDLIGMLRATMSPGLYVQCVGRGTRLSPEKECCWLLDFGGNIQRHGPVDQVTPSNKPTKKGSVPLKKCKTCESMCLAASRVCPYCGAVFPEPEKKTNLDGSASELAAMSDQKVQKVKEIKRIRYSKHYKKGDDTALPTLKVEYQYSNFQSLYHFVPLEHNGIARKIAKSWWKKHTSAPMPDTVDDALFFVGMAIDGLLEEEWSEPNRIVIEQDGKYWRLKKEIFEGESCETLRE